MVWKVISSPRMDDQPSCNELTYTTDERGLVSVARVGFETTFPVFNLI
jgi:hypothetical protein